jgi:hypothetical protein
MELKPDPAQDAQVQALYARWLDIGARTGFAVSLVALLVYVSGAMAPFVPLTELPALWNLPVGRYLELTGAPTGWNWLRLVGHGDYLNLVGIVLFASVTIGCYARILLVLLRQGERLYALIAAVEIAVLLVAAAGPA